MSFGKVIAEGDTVRQPIKGDFVLILPYGDGSDYESAPIPILATDETFRSAGDAIEYLERKGNPGETYLIAKLVERYSVRTEVVVDPLEDL